MNAMTPFVFEDHLVRTVARDGEPWFAGRDVCHVLDIKNESHALSRLDDDERTEVAISDPSGTKYAIFVSEPGVFRLIFTSRKPEAERFKRWLAHEVLPQLRKTGRYAVEVEKPPMPQALEDGPAAAFAAKLSLVREARLIWGTRRAQTLWDMIGLPMPPLAEADSQDEARECLRALLMSETGEGAALFQRIAAAIDGDTTQDILLPQWGIRTRGQGFIVANRHPWLVETFKGTSGDNNRWPYVLRRLPGVIVGEKESFSGHVSRTTYIPSRYLDLDSLPKVGAI